MKKISGIIFALFSILYPVGVYFGLEHIEPRYLILILVLIVFVRSAVTSDQGAPFLQKWLLPIGILVFAIIVFLSNSEYSLRLYPVFMNSLFFCLFAWSYRNPPTIIERAAQTMSRTPLSHAAIVYTRNVTLAWCGFFLINGATAYYTAVFSSIEIWTLYNGFISYCLIGCFFACELIVRHLYKKKHHD